MVLYSLSFGDAVFDLDPMLQAAINNLPEAQSPAYQSVQVTPPSSPA